MMLTRVACVFLLYTALLAMCEAKTRVKVFERGNRNKWPQAIVINNNWDNFVAQTRERLQLPAGSYPVLKFYDSEDFEMQNPEEVDDNQYVFVDTSGQEVAPPLTGGALAFVPRDHFKTPNTKIHVWNYPAGETAETPISDTAAQPPPAQQQQQQQATPGAAAAGGGDQKAEIQARIAQLNQQMDQLAASRRYADAAKVQTMVEELQAKLQSMPDQNSARRAEIQNLLAQLNQRMDQAAAARKYAEAAQFQQQHDALSAELKSL
jgi:hypothetical protein